MSKKLPLITVVVLGLGVTGFVALGGILAMHADTATISTLPQFIAWLLS